MKAVENFFIRVYNVDMKISKWFFPNKRKVDLAKISHGGWLVSAIIYAIMLVILLTFVYS